MIGEGNFIILIQSKSNAIIWVSSALAAPLLLRLRRDAISQFNLAGATSQHDYHNRSALTSLHQLEQFTTGLAAHAAPLLAIEPGLSLVSRGSMTLAIEVSQHAAAFRAAAIAGFG